MKRLVFLIISFAVLSCVQEQQADSPAEQQLPETVKSEFYARGESFNEDKMLNQRVNELSFAQTVTARYVRMRVDMSYSDDNAETVPSRIWGSEIAELDFLLK